MIFSLQQRVLRLRPRDTGALTPVNHTHRARTREPISRALGSGYQRLRRLRRRRRKRSRGGVYSPKKGARLHLDGPGFVDTAAVRRRARVHLPNFYFIVVLVENAVRMHAGRQRTFHCRRRERVKDRDGTIRHGERE